MIDASTEIVIDSKDIEVIIDKNVSLIDNNIDVKTLEPEYDITINRKEYTVVGDELYIPKRYEDAPQWLRDIIDNVTDVALSAKISEINNLTQSLNNLIVELEVAKNTYTQSIISSNDINERINTAIETLNSSIMESDATILGLATTRVTPEQAQAISIDAIRTSLNDTISGNSLGSIISGMQSTTTTGDYTNAQSIEVLQSTIEGNADSTASAINTINTFAGIDSAGAYTYTGLTGYLVDPNTGMIGGGQSELQNTITTTGDNVEAKFEYGSNIKIGGQYHNTGFGLKTTMTGGDGTIADPYNSEFWINAEKFKFTNNAISGQVSPFSIDATGVTPEITFNGIIDFSNISNSQEGIDLLTSSNVVSNNLIKNSEFKIEPKSNSAQWIQSDCWIKHPNNGIDTISTYTIVDRIDGQGSSPYLTHSLIKGSTIVVVQNGSTVDYETSIVFDDDGGNLIYYGYPTLATEWFQFSAYLGFINCSGYLKVAFSNKQGIKISEVNSLVVDSTKQGGGYLDEFHDVHINAQTPTDAFFITVMFVKNGPTSGSESIGIVSKPQLVRTKGSSSYRIPYAPNGDASSNSSLAFSDLRNVTQIDGGKIITGSIDTQHLSATAISGKLIVGSEISGGTISGVNILGSIIKASFIDMSSSLLLSNWKQYTLATIPSAYEANFAHQNVVVNGNTISQLLVDVEGYVRLPAQSGFLTTAVSGTRYGKFYAWGAGPANVPVSFTANKIFDLYPYNSYTVNTLNRVPYTSANISHISGECSFYSRCGVQSNEGCTNSASWSCRVLNDEIKFNYFLRLGGGGYIQLSILVNGKQVYIGDTYHGTVAFGGTILTRVSRGIQYHVTVDHCSFVDPSYFPYFEGGLQRLTGFDTKLIVDINTNETIESFTNGDLIEFYGGSGTFKSDATATVIAIHDVAVNYPVIRAS